MTYKRLGDYIRELFEQQGYSRLPCHILFLSLFLATFIFIPYL